ncbi:MAG: helicase associated domain-containing protein [Lachnospiraceae bacterium]|nr:helicase associated domain-containing protein [Lachnospiraceae bacterium]
MGVGSACRVQRDADHGNCRYVPIRFTLAGSYITPDGDRLGKWAKRNRNEKHKLNEKQIELLDRLGMIWQVRPQKGA